MKISDSEKKFLQLRQEYPRMSFEGFRYEFSGQRLFAEFHFNLASKHTFRPTLSLPVQSDASKFPLSVLQNLLFHIGMVEMISYWKAACPPVLVVNALDLSSGTGQVFGLDAEARQWWRRLFFHGLGEFFYTNGLAPDAENFLSFDTGAPMPQIVSLANTPPTDLVPVGGGKDSAVALTLLSRTGQPLLPFLLNPTAAAREVVQAAGYGPENTITATRTMDPRLLALNAAGFLNGHTPFSALLAFISLLAGALTGTRNIILSNESSASEATIPGTDINHQYSKSFRFEREFREYAGRYITRDLNYFSLVRPLNELQIAGLFAGETKFHKVFRSCNAGSKTGVWCGKCPKCLFTYIILSPFMSPGALLGIFGRHLLDDPALQPVFDQLTGVAPEKPFDCIGTIDEVNAALWLLASRDATDPQPFLLERWKANRQVTHDDEAIRERLCRLQSDHFVPAPYFALLTKAIDERFAC